MPVADTRQAYSREDVRRLLGLSERLLRSWERQKFLQHTDTYDFSGLLALRTLSALRTSKISPARIRSALTALKQSLGTATNPLTELKIYAQGNRIEVQLSGQRMDPSGQLLLDFNEVEIKKLLSFPAKPSGEEGPAGRQRQRKEAELWFETGLDLENRGAPMEDIVAAYRKACELDPGSAGARVNLGTVYFNMRAWKEAEQHYREAIEADPNYALAHYNLGNLFDELGDRRRALRHYLDALQLHANYADAHYNVALVYDSLNLPLKAVQHWKYYLKLDQVSSWAEIARRELSRLKELTILPGNRPGASH